MPYYYKMFKRWFLMFMGKSQFHQTQMIGKAFDPDKILGYPSDLTNKISWKGSIDDDGIIMNKLTNGKLIYFPIAIAQKALGHFDNYLLNKNKSDFYIFLNYTNFLIKNMDNEGLISTWHDQEKDLLNDYSAMTQGQLISCCCRAFLHTNNNIYKESAIKASYHLTHLSNKNLLIKLNDSDLALSEMPKNKDSIILNGWIFSLWGLLDLEKIVSSDEIKNINQILTNSLANNLDKFDTGFWSKYDLGKNIASPFYHDLHIEQLKAMYLITKNERFNLFLIKWNKYKKNKFYKLISIILKIKQKLFMRKYNEFI